MLDKYFLSCLVFTLVKNAVGEISLDYYFGFDDALRSTRYMANCNSNGLKDSCHARCGSSYACLLGKCFCVELKPQLKEDVIEEILSRSKNIEQKDSSDEDSISESESEERGRSVINLRRGFLGHGCHTLEKADECLRTCSVSGQQGFCDDNQECNCGVYRNNFVGRNVKMSNMYTKSHATNIEASKLGLRPTLRHHIAHFCPNMEEARKCVHKCMLRGKPAFCGKDHICYCGHKYGKGPEKDKDRGYGAFADMYTKFFGPESKEHEPEHEHEHKHEEEHEHKI